MGWRCVSFCCHQRRRLGRQIPFNEIKRPAVTSHPTGYPHERVPQAHGLRLTSAVVVDPVYPLVPSWVPAHGSIHFDDQPTVNQEVGFEVALRVELELPFKRDADGLELKGQYFLNLTHQGSPLIGLCIQSMRRRALQP